jgi:membrane protein implicated in regulation of membrane protease activity
MITAIGNVSATLFWLIVMVIMILIEIPTLGLTTIWFAGGALIAFILAALNTPFVVQVVVFLVSSLILLFLTRPIAAKYFNKDRARTNVEAMIGRAAIVVGEIDNLQGIGRVTVGGQEWSARTLQEGIVLPVGTVVVIRAINGVKLMVEERKEENEKNN